MLAGIAAGPMLAGNIDASNGSASSTGTSSSSSIETSTSSDELAAGIRAGVRAGVAADGGPKLADKPMLRLALSSLSSAPSSVESVSGISPVSAPRSSCSGGFADAAAARPDVNCGCDGRGAAGAGVGAGFTAGIGFGVGAGAGAGAGAAGFGGAATRGCCSDTGDGTGVGFCVPPSDGIFTPVGGVRLRLALPAATAAGDGAVGCAAGGGVASSARSTFTIAPSFVRSDANESAVARSTLPFTRNRPVDNRCAIAPASMP
jgi:hypothetical protein